MVSDWRISCTICFLLGVACSINGQTSRLNPSVVSACPGEVITMTCASVEGTTFAHRWTVSVPGYDPVHKDILNTGTSSVSLTPAANSGIEFQIMRTLGFPLVSTITTTTTLDGTMVGCSAGSGEGITSTGTIHILVHPDPPENVITSEEFRRSNATVTLQWTGMIGVSFSVSVTPLESEVMTQDTSFQLTVSYNTEYYVNITATNCAGTSSSSIRLFYVNCGAPSTGNNVVIDGLMDTRVMQGTNVTFSCSPGQVYELIGPVTATCNSSGQWEPNTMDVDCEGIECSEDFRIISETKVDCGKPVVSPNVSSDYNSTLLGSQLLFWCENTDDMMTAWCSEDATWVPDPTELICSRSPPSIFNDSESSMLDFSGVETNWMLIGIYIAAGVLFGVICVVLTAVILVVIIRKGFGRRQTEIITEVEHQEKDINMSMNVVYEEVKYSKQKIALEENVAYCTTYDYICA